MENFYTLLGLDMSMSLPDIQRELAKQATIYNKRRDSGYAQAEEKLNIIERANKVFCSEEKRRDYDKKLRGGTPKENPDVQKLQECRKMCNNAYSYLHSGSLDLAEMQIERAMRVLPQERMPNDLLHVAVLVYSGCKKHDQALAMVNRAILNDTSDAQAYMDKLQVLCDFIISLRNNRYPDQNRIKDLANNFRGTAMAGGDAVIQRSAPLAGRIYGFAARLEYYTLKMNILNPWEFASRGLQLGDEMYSREVVTAIEEQEKLRRKQEEERLAAQKRREAEEAQRRLKEQQEAAERRLREEAFQAEKAQLSRKLKFLGAAGIILFIYINVHFIIGRPLGIPPKLSMTGFNVLFCGAICMAVLAVREYYVVGGFWTFFFTILNMEFYSKKDAILIRFDEIANESNSGMLIALYLVYTMWPLPVYLITAVIAGTKFDKYCSRFGL